MDAKGLIKGLENWAKRVTTGYKDVNVTNMSSSFRNGLAFCAVIHHYRPDLIDFDSLSKENIFENNSLAFSTAEKQLGVPALLEAKDMVEYSHPDRLSIITYLSQLYNCFENQNKVKVMKGNFKRRPSNSAEPPTKMPAFQPKLLSSNRNDTCHVCNHRVFILERLIVDSKLYHTTCFRCSKCNCLLNPGTYVDSDMPGLYECAVCMPDENSDSMETQDTASLDSFDSTNDSLGKVKPVSPVPQSQRVQKSPVLSDKVTVARSSFLQHSLMPKSPEVEKLPSPVLRTSVLSSEPSTDASKKEASVENAASVKAKISVFESNRNSKPESFLKANELDASKLKLSSNSNALNKDVPLPRKSLRNSATLSTAITPDSKLNGSVFSPDKTTKDSPSVETPNALDLKSTSNLNSPKSGIDSPQNDRSNCDTLTSPSVLNKVPSPAARRSLLRSPSTEDETFKRSPKSPSKQFHFGDYKSPLRTSRDIFQTNLQPLKLTIPSVNSSTKIEGANSPNVTSPETVKPGGIEIPQIRSTYARTLPRPGSASVLFSSKEKQVEDTSNSESNLTNVLHSKWSRTTPRRSSLDSDSKTVEKDIKNLDSLSLRKISDNSISGSTHKESSFFQRGHSNTPIPSIRRSLENKRIGLGKPPNPPSEVDSPSQNLTSSSPKLPPTDIKKVKAEVKVEKPEEVYPDDLNPFGDEQDEEYPDDLNPFGDDEEDSPPTPAIPKTIQVEDYDETKNPFASDDDEDTETTPVKPPSSKPPRPAPPQTSPFQRDSSFTSLPSPTGTLKGNSFTSLSSPTGTLKGTLKKRLAPKPPRMSDIFPNESQDSDVCMKSSPSLSRRSLQTPSPQLRKNKPAPPPPPMARQDPAASSKQLKDEDNAKLKSSSSGNEPGKQAKAKKKRPAPPVPIPKRKDNKKIPLKEILREMKEIEEKQRECEHQGREIELLIRDKDKDEEASVEEEEFIMQLFELVNQKNALFRRQAELMYIKRSQRLEEQQSDIETKIRQLMQNPEDEKTDEDRAKEDELILELKDIVDQRSSIIDSIEMDRRRELEEDASVQEQIEIKNGDLPITAEIKEKSTGKTKKFKLKKEKKKKNQENEGGEPKKKEKKKWLSK